MTPEDMKRRTKKFALAIIQFVAKLPRGPVLDIVRHQLGKAGTSVGANYRAVCRARSNADFIAKLGIVEEEADESSYWLELLTEGKLVPEHETRLLIQEANELLSIAIASANTARGKTRSGGQRQ